MPAHFVKLTSDFHDIKEVLVNPDNVRYCYQVRTGDGKLVVRLVFDENHYLAGDGDIHSVWKALSP
jgi:hypothetical protein